jgi:hypothetical protein
VLSLKGTPVADVRPPRRRKTIWVWTILFRKDASATNSTLPSTSHASAVEKSLGKRGKSMRDLAEALRTVWLEGDVPRCGAELKVRAAEALGAWSAAVDEARSDIVKRLKSRRFEHRMWAARAVRAAGWADACDVLAPLAEDPYHDDNGFFLVREAAGFAD